MSHCSKKILVSRNELRETENISARDLDVLIANFLLQEREFLFFICVKKTISMKILVLRVISSSRHRNCGSCVLKASVDRVSVDTLGRYVDRQSADISTDTRSICPPRLGRHIDRHACRPTPADTSPPLSQHLADTLPTLGQH